MQLRQEASLLAFTAVSGSSSAEEGWTDNNAYWETLGILSLLRKSPPWMNFFAASLVVDRDNVAFASLPQWS